MQYIDTHTHVVSPDTVRYPRSPLGGVQSGWSSRGSMTGAGLVQAMDDAGVERALVVQASTVYGFDNSFVADSVAEGGRNRLLGVGSVNLLASDVLDRLEHWIHDRGLVGLRVFSTGSTMPEQADWLDSEQTFPAWRWLEENGVPVCIQARPSAAPMIERILTLFPDLSVLLDHAGLPNLDGGPPYAHAQATFALSRFPNVRLKLTNDNLERADLIEGGANALVHALVDHFGANRIAWGTNFPATAGSLATLVGLAEGAMAGLSDADRSAIFQGTAREVYSGLSA